MLVAVLDACVLFPPSVRDLLMWLASTGAYEPRWTVEIHAEWVRNVLANRSSTSAIQSERTCQLMNQVNPQCLVSGYDRHIQWLSLPDANDRHVLAAAIEARASFIVTFNLSDFPEAILRAYDVRSVHPDPFLCALLDEKPRLCFKAVRTHRISLKRPAKTVEDYLNTLVTNHLTEFAQQLNEHASII